MEKEAEVFGNRTISGFLSQVGAEEAMSSDQVIWSEQGRLHLSYVADVTNLTAGTPAGGTITIKDHIDTGATYAAASHGIRVGDTLLVATSAGTSKCYVHTVATEVISVAPYGSASLSTEGHSTGTDNARVFVYGSEFGKGSGARSTGNVPSHKTYTNKPIILRDYYEVSGSDASQIGWVEVSDEMGGSGYLWYVKAENETRMRFADYVEMAMIEGELGGDSTDLTDSGVTLVTTGTAATGSDTGTQGLFAAITSRGNQTSGITGTSAATDLAEFDAILAEFDNQGAIEENMMFLNRNTSLAVDDMLASMNSYGSGGTSYGVFDNSEDMALNLGFSGFRRGSYDFYKSDWKYLNDKATRGSINAIDTANAIRGVMVPAGVSSVYDQMLGKNLKRPFLHVRYRASQADDRRFKTWVTGSVGAATSGNDAMEVHYLSERCLITQGANNFMLLS